ncbi:alpha/beta hydrolase [Oleiagrimonas sp. C23AA]|uniref:alpha/beta fold hydrolase n=1 Tax=Oleiagrimonas sp. C23AA TaxID=2719047 RepID=UPI00141FDFF2|nr:alpha/beta hydrolase [Oleiagrimonas sp. C23AA]NII12153.1 alpha/beta hydrolase [Oleiagrimonas sp. C23AA]
MRERRIALEGTTLSACQWGADDAPPVIALHGWLDNAASFAKLTPRLTETHRVIALDLPGHGHSDHLPQGRLLHYHFTDYVDAVIAAADALPLEHFALLGHSLGAGVASLAAAALGERITGLALIEGLGPLADSGGRTLERFRQALTQRERSTRKRLRVFASISEAIAARAAASDLAADLAQPIIERAVRAVEGGYSWRSDPRLTVPTTLRLAESQVRDLLAGISAPTRLVLARPTTPYLPDRLMAERIACINDIQAQHLDGGHHLHLEHPQTVADFLSPVLLQG